MSRALLIAVPLLFGSSPSAIHAQNAALDLPNAPGELTSSSSQPNPGDLGQTAAAGGATSAAKAENEPHQTKRIFGIVPNYRSVSADTKLPAQSPRDKFVNAFHDSFDYGSFVLAAVQAGFSQYSDSYPEFHQGVVGYGRYYWHTLADTADENFIVGGILPVALRQDPRFYTLGHGSLAHRALYASTRVLITRTDSGRETFNASEIIGAGAASGISSTYYPAAYRTWTKIGQKWLTSTIIDGATFTFKEFWPDINSRLPRSLKE